MTNSRDSFIFYRSFYEAIEDLPDQDQLQLYKAIFKFSLNFEEIDLSGVCKTIFKLIKPQLQANNKRYSNGSKGGRPSNNSKPKDNQEITKEEPKDNQEITKEEPNKNKNDNKNDNKNKNLEEKYKKELKKQNQKDLENKLEKELQELQIIVPDWIDAENWNEWLKGRKKKKYSNSARAINRILNSIDKFLTSGYSKDDINQSLERSMIATYPEIYEPKKQKNNSKGGLG